MGIKQTERTKFRLLPIPNRPKYGFFQDCTDRNMGFKQTAQYQIWGLKNRNFAANRTEQNETYQNRPKYVY